jgi:DNA/RNA-binding domain of Phe-tRNA-synthetase-like protein
LEKRIEVKVDNVDVSYIIVESCRVEEISEGQKRKILDGIEIEIDKIKKDEATKKVVRDILRFGKYKPSGRGKPSSEYLFESYLRGEFPFINNFVDFLNFVSLKSMLPISLIDFDKARSEFFILRRGKKGESYVFNNSGQVLEVEDLLLIATKQDEPIASPVKDSLKTKIDFSSKRIIAVIYSIEQLKEKLEEATEELVSFYKDFGKIVEVEKGRYVTKCNYF